MKIWQIKKMNLKDGDILFLPEEHFSGEMVNSFVEVLSKTYPEKRVVLCVAPEEGLRGIRIVTNKEK
jgi:hypothetical protein